MPAKIRVSNVRDAIEVTFPNYNFAIVATAAEWKEFASDILTQANALLTPAVPDVCHVCHGEGVVREPDGHLRTCVFC